MPQLPDAGSNGHADPHRDPRALCHTHRRTVTDGHGDCDSYDRGDIYTPSHLNAHSHTSPCYSNAHPHD
jgi:hypothetical protein